MTSAGNRKTKIATVIGSDKGGIGKSLLASLLADAYDQGRRPLSVVEIDHQGKLRTSMGQRVNLSLGASADLGEIAKDRKYAERFYNPVFNCWRNGDSLTDLGANVTTQLFNWMQQCHIGELAAMDGIRFRFVAVTTPDDQALRSAYSALSNAVRQLGPETEYYLVLNAFSSNRGFDLLEHHPVFKDLGNIKQLKFLFIPNCDSDLMEYGRARALSPLAVYRERERLIEEMGLGRVEAHTEQKRFVSWMMEVQEALRPLFADSSAQAAPAPQASEVPSVRSEPAKVHDFPHGDVAERREEAPRRSYPPNGAVVEDLLGRREGEGFDHRAARRVHGIDRAG
ncbi:hypothetical protein ACVIGB_000071 [Bradyrhizobium sp. USDA 4341]